MDKAVLLVRWMIGGQEGNLRARPHCRLWKNFIHATGFCVVVIVLVKWGTGLPIWQDVIAAEHGPVERMSAAIWFAGFVWTFMAAWYDRCFRVEWLLVSIFQLLLGLRELDAHRWATGWNLDKLANYWNPEFPLTDKLIVLGCMVVPCLMVGIILCRRLWQTVGPAWRAREFWLNHLAVTVIILLVCLGLDKIVAYLDPVLGLSDSGQVTLMLLEEFLEMDLAVFAFVSLWPYLFEALFGGSWDC